MSDEAKTPARPAEGQDSPPKEAPLDLSEVTTMYTNWYRVLGLPEELILEFGLTPHMGIVTDEPIRVSQRLVMSFYTAKRLIAHLHYALKRHEETFGALEMDFRKRLQGLTAAEANGGEGASAGAGS